MASKVAWIKSRFMYVYDEFFDKNFWPPGHWPEALTRGRGPGRHRQKRMIRRRTPYRR